MEWFTADDHVLRSTLEDLPIGLVVAEPDGRVVGSNRKFAETLGYPPEAWESISYRELAHPDEREENQQLFEDLMSGRRRFYRGVRRLLTRDGRVLDADLSLSVTRSADDRPRLLVAQVLEVFDREDRVVDGAGPSPGLSLERGSLEAVLDTVDVGVLVLDRDGRYSRMNARFLDPLGSGLPREPSGRVGDTTGAAVFHHDGRTPAAAEDMPSYRASRGEEFDDLRMWVGEDPATRRAYSVSARTVRDQHGQRAGATLAYRDITDLMRALEVKDEFLTTISHELRTPLTSVLGYLQLLAEHDQLPPELVGQVEVIERNALRLQALVAHLLTAAQAHEGGVPVDPDGVDLGSIIEEGLEAARPHAERAEVSLEADVPERVMARVDGHRIRQVLDNLTSNAIKYNVRGGRVTVSLRRLDSEVELAVADTGIGIDPGDRAQLFTRFFRGEQARLRQVQGAGLGLSIVRDIALAHGGNVRAESEPGHGSVFTLTLPHMRT